MMNRYLWIVCSVMFALMVVFPGQTSAGSITPTKAEIGKDCVASGPYSTAMGFETKAEGWWSTAIGNGTTASGTGSIAMGFSTTASGLYSTAVGSNSKAGASFSFAGGSLMELTDTATKTFVCGHSSGIIQSISTANGFLIFPAGTPGKVGIGTGNPYNLVDLGWTLGKKLAVYQGPDGNSFYGFGISSNTLEIYAGADVPDGPAMVVKKTTGYVGIGEADPSYKLHVNGSVAGTSWTNLSSREYKEDIQAVDKAAYPMMLVRLLDMDLTTYKYKKEYGGDGDTKLRFIAEDMPEEVLSKDGKGVDLYELLALTIGAVKAQQKENDALKAKLEQVLARLEALDK